MPQSTQQTPYKNWPNDGVFQTESEIRSPVELEVSGKFPPCVAGTLYRTGPGDYKVETENGAYALSHWFDGFTQLHRFHLVAGDDGCRVYYNSRRQVDELMETARKDGTLNGVVTFGQKRDPCQSFFGKVKSSFQSTVPDKNRVELWNVGVTVARNMPGLPGENRLTCLTDANMIQQADMETLEPLGVTDQTALHPDLKGPISAAHAEHDPKTGDVFSFNLNFGPSATYKVFKTSASTSKTEILATITGSGTDPAYLHSFFLTEDYVVLCVWPAYFAGHGASILWERNVIDALRFHPDAKTKWYIVDRKAGRGLVATLTSPAMFSFHTVNAFQEDNNDTDDIFCDIVQYPNIDVLRCFYYENILSTSSEARKSEYEAPRLVRYKLPGIPKQGKAKLDGKDGPAAEIAASIPRGAELPTINPRFVTKKQRFVYGIADRGYSSFVDGLAKTDMETKEVKYWGKEPEPHTPGEAIFVPDGTEGEDGGYLLSVVLDGKKGTSYLLCLDARDMSEVARAECGCPVGIGFHGTHYSG